MTGKIIDAIEIETIFEEVERESEIKDAVYNTFIGRFPREIKIKGIIEGEILHPGGIGSLLTIEESLEVTSREWVDSKLVTYADVDNEDIEVWLKENRQDLLDKISNNIYSNNIEILDEIYKEIILEDLSDKEEVYSIGDEINRLNKENIIEKNYTRQDIQEIVREKVEAKLG